MIEGAAASLPVWGSLSRKAVVTGALLFFSLGCVYLCSHLPCTFDGWVPILDFLFTGFFSSLVKAPSSVSVFLQIKWSLGGERGSEISTLMIKECVFQEP